MHTSKIAMGAALLASGVIADDVPKRGLAANDDIPLTAFAGDYNGYLSQVNWQYNWNSNTAQKQDYAEFVPMLWGTQDYHTNHWFDDAWDYILNQGTTHLLGFNEPDIPSQSNMSPEDAAAAWRTYMEPFAEDARLGAPAVSNAGLQWITDFMTACNDCQIDFVPIHWYNGAGYDDDFQNWVNSICDLTGRPVWVTEFQVTGTTEDQSAFFQTALPFLDESQCVERYSYFGTADNSRIFIDGDGPGLTPLGLQFAFSAFGSGDGPI